MAVMAMVLPMQRTSFFTSPRLKSRTGMPNCIVWGK